MTMKTAEPQEVTSEVLEGDYKGTPMLIIRQSAQDKFPFQFGIKKARLMLKHMKEIEDFVKRHPMA